MRHTKGDHRFVLFKNIELPAEFFTATSEIAETEVSLFSTFFNLFSRPTPTAVKPKILIVTQSALEKDLDDAQSQIRCCWLTALGFTLYVVCAAQEGGYILKKPNFDTELSGEFFASACNLDGETNIRQLIEQNHSPKEPFLVLDGPEFKKLITCMDQQRNNWQHIYTKMSDEAILSLENNWKKMASRNGKLIFNCLTAMTNEENKWALLRKIEEASLGPNGLLSSYLTTVLDDEKKWEFLRRIKSKTEGNALLFCLYMYEFLPWLKATTHKPEERAALLQQLKNTMEQVNLSLHFHLRLLNDEEEKWQLLDRKREEIGDGLSLALCLKEVTDEIRKWKLLWKNIGKIKNYDELYQCLLQTNDSKEKWRLFLKLENTMKSPVEYFYCLRAMPDDEEKWRWLDKLKSQITHDHELLSCLHAITGDETKKWQLFTEMRQEHDFDDIKREFLFAVLPEKYRAAAFESLFPAELLQFLEYLPLSPPTHFQSHTTIVSLYLSLDNEIKFAAVLDALQKGYYPHLTYLAVGGGQNTNRLEQLQEALKERPIHWLIFPETYLEELEQLHFPDPDPDDEEAPARGILAQHR